ncbi:aminodeoxychorismate/anthranilate synthase component II [Agaribacter marinus]|uniref:anthranilate synthase n=1 Tax=Agaribacter marinus TaxID=1431249 RepID=A0AA37WK74_9ALTE|nr:aminodeoxychorismate/anthranilate synthase component II [Agaribacter marinus]GLR72798.1 glutamine amidotransferase [Agaribacter marinus]
MTYSNAEDKVNNIDQLHVILIDNVDSFTYNLVDELRVLGVKLKVYRNTVEAKHILEQLALAKTQGPCVLMLSPGPGAPSAAGSMPEVIKGAQGKYPVLGICLGHQAIVENYGGVVGHAPEVMHGKASLMTFSAHEIFAGLSNPLSIARYHSLVATDVPNSLQKIAEIDGLPMAILNEADKMLGFQFHPESILTCEGSKLLQQALMYLANDLPNT